MYMKKAIVVTVLAAAMGTSAVGAVSAATPSKSVAVQVQQSSFAINYVTASIRTLVSNGETLVSVRDLSLALKAQLSADKGTTTVKLDGHAIAFKIGSKQIQVDGKAVNLNQPVKSVNGTSFIAVRPFVQALGGTLALSNGQIAINTIKLLVGGENARFVNASQAIVSVDKGDSRTDYLIDVATGKYAELLTSSDTSDLIVAPNGAKAAYTDADGAVYILDLNSKTVSTLTTDNSIKPELVWAADSSAIYFLQGDKGTVIAKLDAATGTISKVVEDKVDYKSALNVSPDGKTFTYLVTTPPKATADATDLDKDTVAIDASGESVQLYSFNTAAEKPAAVQLTTTKDDKLFAQSADGSNAYYVSVADENAAANVIAVDKDKKATTIFAEGDVEQAVLSGGKLYVLTAINDTSSAIYEVDLATGTKKLILNAPADASNIAVNGSQIIVALSDGLYINNNNQWKPISK